MTTNTAIPETAPESPEDALAAGFRNTCRSVLDDETLPEPKRFAKLKGVADDASQLLAAAKVSPIVALRDVVERAFGDVRRAAIAAYRRHDDDAVAINCARKILQNYGVVTPDVNPDGVEWLPGAVRKLCEERDKLAGCLKCVTKSRDWWQRRLSEETERADRARRWCVAFGVLFVLASVGLFAFAVERLWWVTSP